MGTPVAEAAASVPPALPAGTQRMSRVDTAWLRMDTPSNLMMIIGVWLLEPAVSYDTLCARVEERLLKYKRFRQKVVEDPMGALWVSDRRFDIHHHVVRETLAPTAGQSAREALEARVAELAALPLDPKRPLWQMHLIEDYPDVEGRPGSALIARIHHCIADGIALISVMLSITDGGKPPPVKPQEADPAEDERDWLSKAVIEPLTDVAIKAIGLYGDGIGKSVEMLANPAQPLLGSMDMARTGLQVVSDVAALALMADDSPTRLKGKPGTTKRVAWCEPIPLEDVRAVGKALGCSINDVLLSMAA